MSLARRLDVTQIDALLPQTQCTKCQYPGCRPYAEAILNGAAINRCVPGGPEVIQALAELTCRPILALDPDCGHTLEGRWVAFIREDECI
ncbi:MAG: RnfABCDGE type electron transport complex subunit B, partial [Pseudomonadales bacterium]|nr:RnfABCDGE type electron transport complex subunit B [Pseudomonadales bacterium]